MPLTTNSQRNMQCCCRETDSRGKEQRAVHQAAVVVIVDQVILCRGLVADLRFVEGLDLHLITGVVEVDDVDIEDENSRRGDHVT